MGMNLKEMLVAAKAGYKPNDLVELNALTEKYEKNDILSLVSAGYNLGDLKKTLEMTSADSDDSGQDDADEHKPDDNKGQQADDTSGGSGETGSDDIDYKKLYEEEKKLREELQHDNAGADASGSDDKKTDEEIAQALADAILH